MLLLPPERLADRRRLTRDGELGGLYQSLAAELEPLLRSPIHVPLDKALLSRAGGRCERDGTALEFDPWSPREHRCPACGAVWRGEPHDRAWIVFYQLWLAERAVHAALFFALRGEERHGVLARDILTALAERYLQYPNVDNVLGPTRPFFSTYLESIWLLQVCVATDLLRAGGDATIHRHVADRIVEPSRQLIAGFDEGISNRQVWNNAALLAAAALLGDSAAFDACIDRRGSGLVAHLSDALLDDATWYEGENYHQFAIRGLWYGVTLAETRGVPIPAALRDRFDKAFEVLYLTALPDFTMPARKDSQYAVSLRQWRMAELAELGLARRASPVLAGALARTYETGTPRHDTGRSRSAADVERNHPAGALSRSDLGWRALLHALPTLPPSGLRQPRSTLLEAQGLSIFRRAPDVYAALDYGRYGGGHGHPDRLNVTLASEKARWLDDLGTGSYVDPTLHWYRSSLAHNAPFVNGRSQPERDGVLVAHDERGALGWTVASVEWPDPGVHIERALVVAPDYLCDELRWTTDRDARVELPWHLDGGCERTFEPTPLDGGDGVEDGFSFARDGEVTRLRGESAEIRGGAPEHRFAAWLNADGPAELFRALGPGQPAARERRFYVLRSSGRSGRYRALVAWRDVAAVRFTAEGVEVSFADGSRHVHRRDERGWHVELFAMGARSSVDLTGWRSPAAPRATSTRPRASAATARSVPASFELGQRHYRRSEVSWEDAGSPSATVGIAVAQSTLAITIEVRARGQRFVSEDAHNPYDNEHADTMGAGVQLYLEAAGERAAWMLVPGAGQYVRVRPIRGWSGLAVTPTARWRATPDGYAVHIELPLGACREFRLDVLINESTSERERRRGQLVLSGAEGEFVYLRGDRHDEDRMLGFRVP